VADAVVPACRPGHSQPSLTAQDELILRRLEAKYHLPLDRLRAIVRLKALEHRRLEKEGKRPQAHYQEEMERILGVDAGDVLPYRERQIIKTTSDDPVDGDEVFASNEQGGFKRLTEMLNIEMVRRLDFHRLWHCSSCRHA
jgi:hypothetical protein